MYSEFVCTNIVFLLCGYDAPQMNQTMMSTIASHIPAGTSSYTILHYAQEVKNGRRRPYSSLICIKQLKSSLGLNRLTTFLAD